VNLLLDDQIVASRMETLRLTTGNFVQLKCNAPPKACEVKVTLKVEPQPNETITTNNEMTTFVNVSQEGLSVLLVDTVREQPTFIARALQNEPRIRLFDVTFRGAAAANPGQVDLFQFEKQHYDVIILGDVSAQRLRSGNPQATEIVRKLVREGTGLMMIAGPNSLGRDSDWQATEVAELLPVEPDAKQSIDRKVKLVPLKPGLQYLLRLRDTEQASRELWQKMQPLNGRDDLGKPKPGLSTVFAAADSPDGPPLLVGRDFGKGRVLVFAGDESKYWIRPDVGGRGPHDTFWKRLVLWLAHQEEMEGTVWVKLDARRLAAGDKLPFQVGLRGKGGEDRPDGRFEVKVTDPGNNEIAVPTTRDKNEDKGLFWKTDEAGEYRLEVNGVGKDADGKDITGKASARFLVYEDDAEMRQRAANHDFLKTLASAGGGEFHQPDDLAAFLTQLQSQPLPHARAKADTWPDWRRNQTSGFLVGFFLLFVLLLSLEWFLRRRWGLV
ncbi:MAG TPA: glutamine amidotransferase, partial [Gemmataceae bacterium]|nr:glutamine amidotransferase [Gemmataceae bacterium]